MLFPLVEKWILEVGYCHNKNLINIFDLVAKKQVPRNLWQNWKHGDPCYMVASCFVKLLHVISWKRDNIPHMLTVVGKVIAKNFCIRCKLLEMRICSLPAGEKGYKKRPDMKSWRIRKTKCFSTTQSPIHELEKCFEQLNYMEIHLRQIIGWRCVLAW